MPVQITINVNRKHIVAHTTTSDAEPEGRCRIQVGCVLLDASKHRYFHHNAACRTKTAEKTMWYHSCGQFYLSAHRYHLAFICCSVKESRYNSRHVDSSCCSRHYHISRQDTFHTENKLTS
ncbi:hypothetical protein TNCV_71371 [Trichonephila clavipes]|nr:hypothetical protein TNCV_71371 [Trichonephila clavipes]